MSGNEENNFNNNNNNNIINNNDVLIRKEKSKKVKKKDKKRVRTIHVDNAYRRSEELESLEVEKFGPEDFKIVSLLGVGSQGRVYLVELVGTNIYYAMKVFKKDQILQNEKSVRSILTEQRFLATSRHPFVTSLFCSFQSHERLYMVMEYCCGGELFTLMKRQPTGRFTEEQIRFYTSEVLLVLEFVHLNGYIYRDLKPENILLHKDGHIRMADFGLSKQSEKKPEVQLSENKSKKSIFRKQKKYISLEFGEVLRTTSLVGSMQYLAPEVFSKSTVTGGYDIMADWWAFGVLIFEMLASPGIKSVIKGLLNINPKKRLCGKHGANELKNHPFYDGVNWGLLRHRKPPILPIVSCPTDTVNFEIYDEDLDPDPFEFFSDANEDPKAIPKEQQVHFQSFTYSSQFLSDLRSSAKTNENDLINSARKKEEKEKANREATGVSSKTTNLLRDKKKKKQSSSNNNSKAKRRHSFTPTPISLSFSSTPKTQKKVKKIDPQSQSVISIKPPIMISKAESDNRSHYIDHSDKNDKNNNKNNDNNNNIVKENKNIISIDSKDNKNNESNVIIIEEVKKENSIKIEITFESNQTKVEIKNSPNPRSPSGENKLINSDPNNNHNVFTSVNNSGNNIIIEINDNKKDENQLKSEEKIVEITENNNDKNNNNNTLDDKGNLKEEKTKEIEEKIIDEFVPLSKTSKKNLTRKT